MTAPAADEAALLALREEFPTLRNAVHLISHSLGAMPRHARDLARQFVDEWEQQSIEAWRSWLPRTVETGDAIGRILGVQPGTVTIQQNVSTVQAIVASCIPFTPARNKVVYDSLNFSTVHYVWQEMTRYGADVVVIPSPDGVHVPEEALLDAIDERTALVPISHVQFRSSAMYDVRAVVEKAHSVGARVLLDCYQSAGTVPLALEAWGVDMACGGSVKWACGGPGCAYLYTSPEVARSLRPAHTGWFGHARPFAFEMDPVDLHPLPAWHMANGTPPVPALFTARAGWDLLARAGVEAIRAKSLRQTKMLRELVEARGFRVNTPREDARRGGTLCFDFEDAAAVAAELNHRRFFCDYRPAAGLRASPHYYTTDDELHAFVAEIDAIRTRGVASGVRSAY